MPEANVKFCAECGNPTIKKEVKDTGYNTKTGKPNKPLIYTDCSKDNSYMRGKR